ncbi:tetratricopeptide repeat protein [Plantactinospora sp. B24E8]|uniref:tetratricopeptide repeat protein n=1 Tax=Plantactinospora sp. B24E8 TaxID=3153567 RepID=UPI00325CA58F
MDEADWARRLAETWESFDQRTETEFRALIDQLVAELPEGSPVGTYERASAFDATDRPDLAVPLYEEALAAGLAGERRRAAVIQLASSVRNLGRPEQSISLLTAELAAGSDHRDDAVRAFLALALMDAGRAREATSLALTALAPHLTQYQRSVANYARLLVEPDPAAAKPAGS